MANILLVDDRPENLLALEGILEPLQQTLLYAQSGEDALRQLLLHDVALILLDVQMPELDGFETAALIKQRERTRHIPIIFVTAISKDEQQVFRGYSAGAVDYVFKPFSPEVLRSKVSVFIELYDKTEQLRRQAELLKEQELAELRRESEERYRFLAEAQPDQIWTALPSGELDYVNQRALDYFAGPFSELVETGWTQVVHPEDLPRMLERWQQALDTGKPYENELRLRRATHRRLGARRHSRRRKAADDRRRARRPTQGRARPRARPSLSRGPPGGSWSSLRHPHRREPARHRDSGGATRRARRGRPPPRPRAGARFPELHVRPARCARQRDRRNLVRLRRVRPALWAGRPRPRGRARPPHVHSRRERAALPRGRGTGTGRAGARNRGRRRLPRRPGGNRAPLEQGCRGDRRPAPRRCARPARGRRAARLGRPARARPRGRSSRSGGSRDAAARARRPRALALDLRCRLRRGNGLRLPRHHGRARARADPAGSGRNGLPRAAHAARRDLRLRADARP